MNYLCLPHNPKYDRYSDGNQDQGYIYGTEFEVSSYSGYPFRRNLHDHEAPCVVCYVKSRGSMLMMPARNDCPSGWTEEYHGYLMTSYHGHKNQKDFVYVDKDPELVPGSQDNKNGALLYHSKAVSLIVRVNVVVNRTVAVDVSTTCAVVIFRVKVSCITSVDGIILWLMI